MRILQLTSGFVVSCLVLASPAEAQNANSTANSVQTLDEIVVLSQKREQSLGEVPQSIQILDATTLVSSSIRDVSEVMTFIPGASEALAASVGQRRYQIRGLYQESGSSTVGYYIDETPIDGIGYSPMGRVFDMQQVEILRGPQSTLYGNGAMGGVVRYQPNQPDLNDMLFGFRGGLSSSYDGDDGFYADAFLSLPIVSDKLGIRLVASTEELAGWSDTAAGDEDVNGADLRDFRLHVLWLPTDDLEVRFQYVQNTSDQDAGNFLSGFFPDDTITTSDPDDFANIDLNTYSATLEYTGWEFADLLTNFGYTENKDDGRLFLVLPGLSAVTSLSLNEVETVTNETRLVSKGDGLIDWMVGGYFTDRDSTSGSDLTWDPEIPPFFVNSNTVANNSRDSTSFFGEVSWNLLDGKFVPLLGVRYAEETFEGDTPTAAGRTGGETFDTTNLRFNLSWFPNDSAHYYLNVAEGFRSGNFNLASTCETHNLLLIDGTCELVQDSDEVTSYEIGAKYTLLDGRLYVDAAVYFQDWQRTPLQLPIGGLFATYNVGDSDINGIDLSLNYSPASVDGLDLSLVANWNSAEFADVNTIITSTLTAPFEPESVGAVSGERLPFAPEYSLVLAANYGWEFGQGFSGSANVTYNHIGGQFGQFGANTEEGDSRDLLRLRIGVQKGNSGVFLFGRNLLDSDSTIFAQAPTGGVPLFTRDHPRQVGIEFTYNMN